MATPSTQIDRVAIQERTLEILRQFLEELGHASAALHGSSHLERDLSLGSLERIELLTRLDSAFRVHLPDEVFNEAETMNDLFAAVAKALSSSTEPFAVDRVSGRKEAASDIAHTMGTRASTGHSGDGAPAPDIAQTMIDVLRHRGHADASRTHICLRESSGEEQTITFGALLDKAEARARALEFRGLEAGGAVAIMLPTCCEFFFAFFGVMLAGGIPVPIYPPTRPDRIEEYAARQAEILRNAEARFLITFRAAERVARLLKPQVPSLRTVLNAEELLNAEVPPSIGLRHRVQPDDIAFLQYTSGSTGAPKGVVVTQANLLANLRAIGETIHPQRDDVVVSWLPLYHDMGLIGAWFVPLFFGLKFVALSPFAFLTKPARWLRAIHDHRGTLTAAPNFAYELCVRKIADHDLEGIDLGSLRAALNGAESVYAETLERFRERFAPYGLRPEAVLPVYGLAEATLAVSASPFGRRARVEHIDRAVFEREGRAVPVAQDGGALTFVSAGVLLPGLEVRIAGADGSDAGERVEGQLWFRGPSATCGYYRNPEATAEIIRQDGWIDSGDRAYRAGGEIFITGRTKDVIIKAGRNLYPHEVEAVVSSVAGVRRGCVVAFGAKDAASGTERLVVAAEIREPSEATRIEAEITQGVAATLGIPPDVIKLVPPQSIPKTSSGKLRRAETRRLYLEGKLGERLAPAWLQAARVAARGTASSLTNPARTLLRRTVDGAYGIYAWFAFLGCLVLTALLVWLAPNRRAAARFNRYGCRVFLASIGWPVRVEGRERIAHLSDGSACVFAANHSSYLDAIVLAANLPVGSRFSAKMELGSWPFVGMMMRKLGQLIFDRNDSRARLRQAEEIEEVLRHGESVVVFPEGTFTPAMGLRPFQLGAFKAAVAAGKPVCPVALRGARQVLRDGTLLPKPGRITLTFCAPVEPADKSWQEIVRLRDTTRAAMAPLTGEPLL